MASRLSVDQIITSVSGIVNQDVTSSGVPSDGSTEWSLWLSFINRAVREWSEATDWEVLTRQYYPAITGTTQSTLSLPQDFKKLADQVRLYGSTTGTWDNGQPYPEVMREEKDLQPGTANWVSITGDINNGFLLIMNPGTLASGASLMVPYFSIPTSLASPNQIPLVTDSDYIIDRVTAFIFEARSDSRFQEQEAKAREKLLTLIENHDVAKYNSFAGQTPVHNTTRLQGFRWGRD